MKKPVLIIVASAGVIACALILFLLRDRLDIRTPSNSSSTLPLVEDTTRYLTAKYDPFRIPGSPTPLKDTILWERINNLIQTNDEYRNYQQARIVGVVTPLLEYDIELLTTKERRTLSLTPETIILFPEYMYDEKMNITDARYNSTPRQQEVLAALEVQTLMLLYVKNPESLRAGADAGPLEVSWIAIAN